MLRFVTRRARFGLPALLVWFLAVMAPLAAGPCPEDRPCVGLVLAGGGARGAAHIGVIEVMEELQVPVDFIVGTSMGAIVGGMYASGVSPEQMQAKLDEIDWAEAFNDHPPRRNIPFRQKQDDDRPLFKLEFGFNEDGFASPLGLVAGQKLNFILGSLLLQQSSLKHFDDLPIPFRATAVDLQSGDVVVLEQGDLARSIRASMAFPVVFTPVEIDGRQLVDGGVLRNLPVDVAIELGADRIIAIDVGTPMSEMGKAGGAFQVARRTISVMTREVRAEQLKEIRPQDLLIEPELEGFGTFDSFDEIDAVVQRGVEAARGRADDLRELAVDDATFARYLERQRRGCDRHGGSRRPDRGPGPETRVDPTRDLTADHAGRRAPVARRIADGPAEHLPDRRVRGRGIRAAPGRRRERLVHRCPREVLGALVLPAGGVRLGELRG